MTQISKATFNTTWAASGGTFQDNTTRDISEADLRQFSQDIKDSCLFVLDTNLSTIVSTKITIPSASILIANATPITLISAPGSGNLIELISLSMFLDYNSAAYATNLNLRISYDTSVIVYNTASILGQTSDTYVGHGISAFTPTTTNISNKAIFLDVATGNPTAGNSPLYVYLTYRVITL